MVGPRSTEGWACQAQQGPHMTRASAQSGSQSWKSGGRGISLHCHWVAGLPKHLGRSWFWIDSNLFQTGLGKGEIYLKSRWVSAVRGTMALSRVTQSPVFWERT